MPSKLTSALALILSLIANPVMAGTAANPAAAPACAPTDTACQLPKLEALADKISETDWRDQTYREIAKLYAARNEMPQALAIVPKIHSDDTKALTIRGIGMAAADLKLGQDALHPIFASLKQAADKIAAPPSQAIAYTYIALAQARAKDNDGALITAKGMSNAALRHKALGDGAEIQANDGEVAAALQSLAAIDDLSFRNKAAGKVARAFADHKQYDNAFTAADKIENNPYEKARAVLYILARQITPDEVTLGISARPGEVEP